MAQTYPYGYAGATVTEAQLATKTTWQRLHPEMRRRFLAMMQEAATRGVSLGVGTGWRKQPTGDRAGFAKPGNSYHEGFMPGGTTRPDGVNDRNAMAIDSVLSSAWPWMNANCGRYGLIHFASVNSEPWHVQPAEIPRSRNFATAQPPLKTWPLPDGTGGIEEEDFMTPEDKAYLEAKFAGLDEQIWARKVDDLPTVGGSAADLLRKSATTAGLLAVNSKVDAILAAINEIDPAALEAAVTAAVTAALEGVEVNADLSADDIAAIAAASAAATVAEIAS